MTTIERFSSSSISSPPISNGTEIVVSYSVSVTNAGELGEYSLTDELNFGTGFNVIAGTVTSPDVTPSATCAGAADIMIVAGQSIEGRVSHTFSITVRTAQPLGSDLDASDCIQTPGEIGTGLLNTATITDLSGQATAPDSDGHCCIKPIRDCLESLNVSFYPVALSENHENVLLLYLSEVLRLAEIRPGSLNATVPRGVGRRMRIDTDHDCHLNAFRFGDGTVAGTPDSGRCALASFEPRHSRKTRPAATREKANPKRGDWHARSQPAGPLKRYGNTATHTHILNQARSRADEEHPRCLSDC